jgi:hypothetical protein
MRIQKILINFKPYSEADLVQYVQAIILALTGNTYFPTPQPTLPVVTTALEELQDAMSKAANGGPADTAEKDLKRAALVVLLKQLASYIELVSAGNVAMMLSSGMKTSKEPSPVGPLPKPSMFEAEVAGKGMIRLLVNAIYGAKLYKFEYKQQGATEWTEVTVTKSKLLLTGLERGKEYFFRVLPMGVSEVRQYSDEISSFVV